MQFRQLLTGVRNLNSRGEWGSKWTPHAILVALSFCKLQTFLNDIPEGNPLKLVYLTPENCNYIQAYVSS